MLLSKEHTHTVWYPDFPQHQIESALYILHVMDLAIFFTSGVFQGLLSVDIIYRSARQWKVSIDHLILKVPNHLLLDATVI